MEPKRTKYDTNPLDGKVAERADKSFESRPGAPTEEVRGGPTRDIGRTENEAARAHPESESQTRRIDREGTRLTSSHQKISYAVFCLKKKKKNWRSLRCCTTWWRIVARRSVCKKC